jgi:hypothetical protein
MEESHVEKDNLDDSILKNTEKIQMILRQTNYDENTVKEKLIEYNNDEVQVIKAYFGITEKKTPPIKSINQEIYRQLRFKLVNTPNEYNNNDSTTVTF